MIDLASFHANNKTAYNSFKSHIVWSISKFLCLFLLDLSVCFYVCFSVCFFVPFSVSLYVSEPVSASVSLPVSLTTFLSFSLCLFLCVFLYFSVCICPCFSICFSLCFSISFFARCFICFPVYFFSVNFSACCCVCFSLCLWAGLPLRLSGTLTFFLHFCLRSFCMVHNFQTTLKVILTMGVHIHGWVNSTNTPLLACKHQ